MCGRRTLRAASDRALRAALHPSVRAPAPLRIRGKPPPRATLRTGRAGPNPRPAARSAVGGGRGSRDTTQSEARTGAIGLAWFVRLATPLWPMQFCPWTRAPLRGQALQSDVASALLVHLHVAGILAHVHLLVEGVRHGELARPGSTPARPSRQERSQVKSSNDEQSQHYM